MFRMVSLRAIDVFPLGSILAAPEANFYPMAEPLNELPSLEHVAFSTVVDHRKHPTKSFASRVRGNQNIVRRSNQTGREIDAEFLV